MKTAISRSVYRMKVLLSMAAQASHRQGYLLIELMIALVSIALCSFLVAQLQIHMVHRYYEAEQYLKAVNYVSRAFEERLLGTRDLDGYTIETITQSMQEELSYKKVAVTISWNTPRGITKNITIHGGILDESTSR